MTLARNRGIARQKTHQNQQLSWLPTLSLPPNPRSEPQPQPEMAWKWWKTPGKFSWPEEVEGHPYAIRRGIANRPEGFKVHQRWSASNKSPFAKKLFWTRKKATICSSCQLSLLQKLQTWDPLTTQLLPPSSHSRNSRERSTARRLHAGPPGGLQLMVCCC